MNEMKRGKRTYHHISARDGYAAALDSQLGVCPNIKPVIVVPPNCITVAANKVSRKYFGNFARSR
jgi:hypothetical protein